MIRYVSARLTQTAEKMKFSITDFFSKCDQIRSTLRILSHVLKKTLMENTYLHNMYGRFK